MQDMQDMQETGRFEADRHPRSLLRHGRGSWRVLRSLEQPCNRAVHACGRTHARQGWGDSTADGA